MTFTRTYDIPYFNVGADRKLRITSLMQYLEDMAIRHSEECGIGLDFYEENKVAWVLAKWDIEVLEYPVFNQKITITTEPSSFRSYFGFRRYEVRDADGELLARAATLWIYVDMRRKRPIPVTEEIIKAFGVSPDSKRPIPLKAPEPPETARYETHYPIRLGDIDTNRHVNNIRYVEWALETLPPDFSEGKRVTRVMVDYRKELVYGEEVLAVADVVSGEDGATRSRHRVGNGDKDACLATFEWS
ncbi:thioesterase [Balneolales bacterium ANBcel1]|nr:thioesterase [Balneolales bacterium ANBcel1]